MKNVNEPNAGEQNGQASRAAGLPGRQRANRRTGIPLYYQVMRDLKEQILSGKLGPMQQLPSEAQLTERFHVSRVVVRQALQILDEQGLITRVRGKGTYVSEKVAEDATPRISGSLEDLIRMGPEVSYKVVEFRLVKASRDLAETFACDEGADLFHVQRVRLVHDKPLALLVNHLPYDVGARISLSDLSREPLIVLIETRAGKPIEWASQVFEAMAADEYMAELLEVDLLTPLLKLTLTAYSLDGSVVDLAEVYYRSDRYKHHGFLTRNRGNGSSFWNGLDDDPGKSMGGRHGG
jgi:GntR family transcriptional regulator